MHMGTEEGNYLVLGAILFVAFDAAEIHRTSHNGFNVAKNVLGTPFDIRVSMLLQLAKAMLEQAEELGLAHSPAGGLRCQVHLPNGKSTGRQPFYYYCRTVLQSSTWHASKKKILTA